MSVTIKLSNGTQKNVDVPDLSITVARFKEIASDVTNIPADEQRVVLRGRVLKDDDILSVMGLEHGQALHIVRGQKSKKQDVNPAPPPAAPTRQEAQTHSSAQPVQETINPYTALAANSPATGGLSGNNLGNTNAGFPVSPDFMSTMMQNPMFMQFFQERMRDPQFLNQAMQQRQDPLGMSGGEIQRLLSNPMFMQLVMQMMSDPTAMQQMAQSMGGGFPSSNAPLFGQPNTQGMNPMLNAGAPQPRGDSRVLYQSQLQQLREMGFPNEEANLAALEQAQGNIDFAIERLLNA